MLKRFLTVIGFISIFGLGLVGSAKADATGQNQTFFVDKNYDAQARINTGATLKYVSNRAYGYVDDGFWNSLNSADQKIVLNEIIAVLGQFDNKIYPVETQIFGSEPNPGIDNDSKITILFLPLIENAGGYFNTNDCYPKSDINPISNQREMFYLNSTMLSDSLKMDSFLAHEFQHLIAFNQKDLLRQVEDDTWLNETRSEYAITLTGYNDIYSGSNLEKRLQTFLSDPSDSLTEWKNLSYDYGEIALFGEYLSEHWTNAILADSLKSDAIGIPSINSALAKNGFPENFADVFRDWTIANFLNNSTLDLKFGYLRPELQNFRVSSTKVLNNLGDNVTLAVGDSLKDWQARWYDISNFAPGQNPILKISFSSPSLTSFQVPYLVYKTDGTIENKIFEPTDAINILYLSGIGADITRVVLMPFKKDKISGFSADEPAVAFAFTVDRELNMPVATPTPIPTMTPAPPIVPFVKPSDFGLHEGDFIRAVGDIDVYIINDFGYKRLILNPAICLMYGHLGQGCFSAVKVVAPSVRDAFITSWFFTNGETKDGKVYRLVQTSGDTATLHWLNISGADFISEGGDFNSVFLINSNEQRSYQPAAALLNL
ncbi:MAG: hypothetical protein ABR875_00805 [Minisyncoccia bacterium]